LVKARELNAFQRPSKRDYQSFRQWFFDNNPLSYEREEEFIKRKEDLISLRHGREWSGFDGFIESCVRKVHCPLTQKIFTTKELRDKTNDEAIRYYSQSRIEKLVGVIITLIIFVLLVLPVVAMYKLTSIGDRNSTFDAVGILVVFTLLFSAAMSLLTKAKRHELFAASAAYCALLVVFISNYSNGNVGKLPQS
jgi:amino acid permease